jgi:hypothetical protein
MSHFLNNEPCPRCRRKGEDLKGDNLAIYSDGHKYCFKCGFYRSGDAVQRYKEKEPTEYKELDYPEVCTFSDECLSYLRQYGLTNDEIYKYLNGHEDGYTYLDKDFYFIRRLEKLPKVLIYGKVVGNEPIFKSETETDTIVLVEDVLSAIKVSRVNDCCALLKTAIHDILLYRLAKDYSNVILWLDADMYSHMTSKLLPKIKPYFNSVRVVMSNKDPKTFSTKEIKKFLNS